MERIQDPLLRYARILGSNEALIVDGSSATYADLARTVGAAILYLKQAGVRPGDRVAFESRNKLTFIQTFFGIVSAGAIAVPIYDGATVQTVAEIVGRTRPRLLLSDRDLAIGANVVQLPVMFEVLPDLATALEEMEGSHIGDDAAALIMFTSGTTARKKGVILSHGNLCQAVRNINTAMGIDETVREYVTMPLYHSFGLGRLRCVISVGGTLAMNSGPFSPLALAQSVRKNAINAMSGVPAVFATLIELFGPVLESIGAQINVVEIGSAEMPRAHKERLLKLMPNARIFMHYGLTEASRSAFIEFRSQASRIDTVGTAAPNVDITIRDDDGRELPHGQFGEIVVSGRHVCVGYLDSSDVQRQRLCPEGFFTGDFGCLDAEGFLTLSGRKDDMINYAGIKISPLEVERYLTDVLKGCDFAVVGVKDPKGLVGETPVLAWAQLPATRNRGLDNRTIASLADAVLDNAYLPRQIVEVEQIPRTVNGKVKRSELRDLLIGKLGG
jgi:long-chain acyl-CoA synthetase